MNRKADVGDWPDFIGVFLAILIIGAGIVGAYYSFFSKEYDFRKVDSELLANRIEQCLNEHGFNLNISSDCKINSNFLSGKVLIYIKRQSDGLENFSGIYDYLVRCGLNSVSSAPICVSREVSIGSEKYYLLVASNQKSREVVS